MKLRIITRTIWVLSFVSLFNDVASEMLYPILPAFLKSIGFSFVLIGILEGLAEATAGISKGYFGKMSDKSGKRLPYVQLGYLFSAVSKPLMAIFVYPLWIFFARTLDRLGKGVRTAARDAMLSDECEPQNKGKVFGFHRMFDSMGAVIGPAIAMAYLYFHPADYRTILLLAFIPGVASIAFTFFIKEKKKHREVKIAAVNFFAIFSYWKNSPHEYKRLVTGLLLFALFNSSDVFLLLKMKESGLNDIAVIGVYIFYNFSYAALSYPAGYLADKLGMKKILLLGLFVFAVVYAGFAVNNNRVIFFALFLLYGLYAAATDGISKAWITNMVSKNETATAIGTFTGLQSICLLLASTLTGFLWANFGSRVTFTITAFVTLLVIIYMSQQKVKGKQITEPVN